MPNIEETPMGIRQEALNGSGSYFLIFHRVPNMCPTCQNCQIYATFGLKRYNSESRTYEQYFWCKNCEYSWDHTGAQVGDTRAGTDTGTRTFDH